MTCPSLAPTPLGLMLGHRPASGLHTAVLVHSCCIAPLCLGLPAVILATSHKHSPLCLGNMRDSLLSNVLPWLGEGKLVPCCHRQLLCCNFIQALHDYCVHSPRSCWGILSGVVIQHSLIMCNDTLISIAFRKVYTSLLTLGIMLQPSVVQRWPTDASANCWRVKA